MAKYKVYGSETTNSKGNEYETKSMLYLMTIHERKDDLFYYVIDVFNDVTGMSKDGGCLIDVQSKGNKTISPYQLGERLITLFKNYISEFNFDDYILVLFSFPVKQHLKQSILPTNENDDLFSWFENKEFKLNDLLNDNAFQLCKNGIYSKISTYKAPEIVSINEETDKLDKCIEGFFEKVKVYVAYNKKSKYISKFLSNEDFDDEIFLDGIFDEISKNQIFKKQSNIEGSIIRKPLEVLNFEKHFSIEDIQILVFNRILMNDYVLSAACPSMFIHYLYKNKIDIENHDRIIEDCKNHIKLILFNTNNRENFWNCFIRIYSVIKSVYEENRVNYTIEYCSLQIKEEYFDSMLINKDIYTKYYFLAMMMEGILNDKNFRSSTRE